MDFVDRTPPPVRKNPKPNPENRVRFQAQDPGGFQQLLHNAYKLFKTYIDSLIVFTLRLLFVAYYEKPSEIRKSSSPRVAIDLTFRGVQSRFHGVRFKRDQQNGFEGSKNIHKAKAKARFTAFRRVQSERTRTRARIAKPPKATKTKKKTNKHIQVLPIRSRNLWVVSVSALRAISNIKIVKIKIK